MDIGDVLNHKHRVPRKKYWMGARPTNCDLCGITLTQTFVDGRIQSGSWGILCAGCHRDDGCGLGTGNGQRYDLKTLEKIDG